MTFRSGRAALLALAVSGCSPSDRAPDEPTDLADEKPPSGEYAKDSVIVRFRTAGSASNLRRASDLVRGSVKDDDGDGIDDRFAHIAGGELAVIRLDGATDVRSAIARLREDPAVRYAEPNYIVRTGATPDDSRFAELYGLHNNGQTGGTADADIDAVEAWDVSTAAPGVVVGVVDSGIDYGHEDLASNMWVNPAEIAGNGVDDDGNGIVDDIHGFNAINGSGDPMDDNDHGTHCAGTIGAVGDNGVGVAGVNWDVQLMALKFLNQGGFGTTEAAIAAIDYAVAQRSAGVNLQVLSNSWGGGDFSQALLDAIESAGDAGILFVAAAGNSSSDNDVFPVYPATYDSDSIVAVAATDHNDALADFSSFGATTVDLGAPGVDVLSTTPGNTYSLFSGTSMATPHVSGVAALALSVNETLTVAELKELLLSSGDPIPALAGFTVTGRRLNAASALEQAGPPVPRFTIAVNPPSLVATQGETASFAIDIASLAGFSGDVALSVVTEPAIDADVAITPVVTAPGSGTLTVATSIATATGLYALTITGQSGDLVRTRTISLRVRAEGDPLFGITVSPALQGSNQGELGSFSISVQSLGGTGTVSLAMTSDPPLPNFFFDPEVVGMPGGSLLFVFSDCDTPPGDYDITVSGTDEAGTTVTASAVLTVQPFGAFVVTLPSTDTPLAIPDADPDGVSSTVAVPAEFPIAGMRVAVDITHPSIGDLLVELVGPDGTAATLHDHEGGGADDIRRTYGVAQFNGTSSSGSWQLRVSDTSGAQTGTLDAWTLDLVGVPASFPPFADFFASGQALEFEFIDMSVGGDCGGSTPMVAWEWDFGDGGTSTEQFPLHTFPAPGDYTVTLTVTDANGLTATTSHVVTATRQFDLWIVRVTRDPDDLEFRVDLRWSEAEGAKVEVYRNDNFVVTTKNDGKYRDQFTTEETAFVWWLCEEGTPNCSNDVFIDFGPNPDAGQATVTTTVGGRKIVETMTIERE